MDKVIKFDMAQKDVETFASDTCTQHTRDKEKNKSLIGIIGCGCDPLMTMMMMMVVVVKMSPEQCQ